MTDQIRIDHFRGFAAAWGIPRASGRNAKDGAWIPAKGTELFDALGHTLERTPFFAEDLGIITEDVEALRVENNLMGMKILQFAFLKTITFTCRTPTTRTIGSATPERMTTTQPLDGLMKRRIMNATVS